MVAARFGPHRILEHRMGKKALVLSLIILLMIVGVINAEDDGVDTTYLNTDLSIEERVDNLLLMVGTIIEALPQAVS